MHVCNCVYSLQRRFRLLTDTHGATLAIYKRGAGTGHRGARDLVTHNLGLLSSANIRDVLLDIRMHRKCAHLSIWLSTTWQVHLVQLSTTQSSLSSKRRPSCQHMFFSLESFILPRASFMIVFSSVWAYDKRKICSQRGREETSQKRLGHYSWRRHIATNGVESAPIGAFLQVAFQMEKRKSTRYHCRAVVV